MIAILTDAEIDQILHKLEEEALPEGLYLEDDGTITFECRSCGELREWFADVEDFELGDPNNVCGGSPWCLP